MAPNSKGAHRNGTLQAVSAHGARPANGCACCHDAPPAVPPPGAAIVGDAESGGRRKRRLALCESGPSCASPRGSTR